MRKLTNIQTQSGHFSKIKVHFLNKVISFIFSYILYVRLDKCSFTAPDQETTGNNDFCSLLPKQDLRLSFLMYFHQNTLQ